MHLAIRRLKVKPGLMEEGIQRIENGFVPLISSMPGFVEYYTVDAGEDIGFSISVFETQEQADESNRRSAEWTKQNLAPLSAGPLEVVAVGEVRIRKTK